MTKYNIELRTEAHVAETLVVQSADLTALRVQVAQFVGDLLKEHAQQIWIDEDWRVDVTDERGLILMSCTYRPLSQLRPLPREHRARKYTPISFLT